MTPPARSRLSPEAAQALLCDLFEAAIRASMPETRIPPLLPPPPAGRILVLAAGKAAIGMARAVEAAYAGLPRLSGLVIAPHGTGEMLDQGSRLTLRHGAHPVPDAAGESATAEMMAMTAGLTERDLVIGLISGGASALLAAPAPGLVLADEIALNRALLASGATIAEMNRLRRHASRIKGGRLAQLCAPARVVTLLVSDVPGDDPAVIASGPFHSDGSDAADAIAVMDRYRIDLPVLRAALKIAADPAPRPDALALAAVETHIVCSPQEALNAAAALARDRGIAAHILGDALEGEAREMGAVLAGIARQVVLRGQPFVRPCVLLSGGEATVTLDPDAPGLGKGGRNVEFLLSYVIHARGIESYALAADTDGIDGAAPVAGALIGPDSHTRALQQGLDPAGALARHDGHGFFAALGAQLVTGPTGTNVNDFRAILLP